MIAHGAPEIEDDRGITTVVIILVVALLVGGGVGGLVLALRGAERRARASVQAEVDALSTMPGLVRGRTAGRLPRRGRPRPERAARHGHARPDRRRAALPPRGGGVADETVLPTGRVTGAERSRSFQRYPTDPRVTGPQLLVVEAEGVRGPERIAWTIDDAAGWAAAITSAATAVRTQL